MTPYEIVIMLHLHTSRSVNIPGKDAPIYPSTIRGLKADGLLWEDGGVLMLTERGVRYCEMLKAVPLPSIVDQTGVTSVPEPPEGDKPPFLRKIMD